MIYLDTSATTSMYPEIIDIIKKYAVDNYYNPSALYTKALNVSKDIKEAKQKILNLLNGNGSIIFTASGTESDNMAMFGSKKFKNCKVLVSNIEHSAIYQSAKKLEMQGVNVEYVSCDKYGSVDEEDFKSKLSDNVALVSIMHACNETGAINDIERLVKLTKAVSPKAIFHSDGVQAVCKIPVNLNKLGVDLYTFSAHKFHGMKGVGGLYIKKGININPIIFGGGQENGLRSATENVSGIISTAFALEKTYK
ncbi:MAG: aminotransferase class V-fold PLP-dependent enzyme, partial [Clostridia bacterium]|nr:aminotransferase class V-fold PLP-dependent enzyme [Clostridia bacterium]